MNPLKSLKSRLCSAYQKYKLIIAPPQAVRKVRNSELDRPSALLWKG